MFTDDAAEVLRAEALSVTYGGVAAVADVSLRVPEGGLVGLIGPNGAGKTTTIDALTGFASHRGRVHVAGVDVTDWSAHHRARAGMARTWQSLELFDDLSVRENCRVAATTATVGALGRDAIGLGRDGVGRSRHHSSTDAVERALEAVGLLGVAELEPTALSLGQRKLASIARALSASPRVLLLDEPAAGLDTDESLALGATLRGLLDTGVSIFLIDHDMNLVLGVCDDVYVLDFGRLIAHGTPAEIRRDGRVIEAYLGTKALR